MKTTGNTWLSIYQCPSFSPGLQNKKAGFWLHNHSTESIIYHQCKEYDLSNSTISIAGAACSAGGFRVQKGKVMPCKQLQSSSCRNQNVRPQIMILKFLYKSLIYTGKNWKQGIMQRHECQKAGITGVTLQSVCHTQLEITWFCVLFLCLASELITRLRLIFFFDTYTHLEAKMVSIC